MLASWGFGPGFSSGPCQIAWGGGLLIWRSLSPSRGLSALACCLQLEAPDGHRGCVLLQAELRRFKQDTGRSLISQSSLGSMLDDDVSAASWAGGFPSILSSIRLA